MHIFKKLLLVTCCVANATFCTELPTEPVPTELNNAQIQRGIQILNGHFHELEKTLKTSTIQNERFHQDMLSALKKATRTVSPLSAVLITLLSSILVLEHKDTLKAALTKENAKKAWDQREEIYSTVKESALTACLKIKETMQKAAQAQAHDAAAQQASASPVDQGQNPVATEQVTPAAAIEAQLDDHKGLEEANNRLQKELLEKNASVESSAPATEGSSTPATPQNASEFKNPNNQRQD